MRSYDYEVHCNRCDSRTAVSTDGNGRLVERLNHPCHCPPLEEAATELTGAAAKAGGFCLDCGAPISPFAKRCQPHGRDEERRRASENQRRRKARAA